MTAATRKDQQPTDFAVEFSGSASGSLAVICRMGNDRLHYWTDEKLGNDERTVFKNPPAGVRPGDPGYYTTRSLLSTRGQGLVAFRAMQAAAPQLVAEARRRRDEKRHQDELQNQQRVRDQLKRDAALELFDALRMARDHLAQQRADLFDCVVNQATGAIDDAEDRAAVAELDQALAQCDAALAKAAGGAA
jgi:hypothetical protein